MKILVATLFFSITLLMNLFPQTDNTCGTLPLSGESIDLSQEGGIYLTAADELKVLIVFVRFKDDVAPHAYWPAGQPPQNHTTFIDPNPQTNSTHYVNLTNYYKKMSLGMYKVTGQVLYVETPQNKSFYGTPWPNRFKANKDVLQNVVDPLINFNQYDNWSSSSNYNHPNQPDGTVDMIIMIWRGLVFSDQWSGEASLGGHDPDPPFTNYFYVENGAKLIKTSYGLNAGSGVTVQYWGERTLERNFKVTAHEIGHWLLGSSHPYDDYVSYNRHRVWGMLTLGDDGICANTYERERVGWIDPTPVTGDILNAPFQDYVEFGSAYKYHPPNGETNEYYYFENHQKINIYDNATQNSNDLGMFIIHQRNIYNSTDNIRIKTSNGQWNWENPFNTICFGGVTVPVFKQLLINRAGLNNRDMLPRNGGGGEWLFAYMNRSGTYECGGWLHGAGLDNSFNMTYNNVFSPYSNPYSHTWLNNQNNFTMEITGQNGSVVSARFYLTNPTDGKPAKPQNLRVNSNQYNEAVLTWETNIEPDIINGGQYKIYRAEVAGNGQPTNWSLVATINAYNGSTPVTSWTDPESYIYFPTKNYLHYKISALDNTSKESVPSESVRIYGRIPKQSSNNKKDLVVSYLLGQNHPNPFNPATKIYYEVKEKGFVILTVYDLLGREVANLVNENKDEGRYTVDFSANNLPSGVHIYTLRVNDFTSSKKMTVLK